MNQIGAIGERIPKVLEYAMLTVQANYQPSENVIKSVIGLMGDLAKHEPNSKSFLNQPNPIAFLNVHRNSPDYKIRELASWASQMVGASY